MSQCLVVARSYVVSAIVMSQISVQCSVLVIVGTKGAQNEPLRNVILSNLSSLRP